MTASITPGRALRYARGSARGLLHHHPGHCPYVPNEAITHRALDAVEQGRLSEDGLVKLLG